MTRRKGKRSRKRDWDTDFLADTSGKPVSPCDLCPHRDTARCFDCPVLQERMECLTHTEGQAWPELWGDMADCERHNAYNDGTARSHIVRVVG